MTVAELSIPQGWDAISAEWMTAALAGHFPGVQVDDVAVVLRDDGTNRRARLQLTYSAGVGPATVFAKAVMPTADEIWLRYRASVAHALAIWMATLSGGDAWQRPDICLAFAQRYSAAFIDLETRAALDAIDA